MYVGAGVNEMVGSVFPQPRSGKDGDVYGDRGVGEGEEYNEEGGAE